MIRLPFFSIFVLAILFPVNGWSADAGFSDPRGLRHCQRAAACHALCDPRKVDSRCHERCGLSTGICQAYRNRDVRRFKAWLAAWEFVTYAEAQPDHFECGFAEQAERELRERERIEHERKGNDFDPPDQAAQQKRPG